MRVLVDLLFWTGTRGGMESYVREIYRRMGDLAPDIEFVGLASSELARVGADWFPGRLVDSRTPGQDRIRWAWGELTAVNRAARRESADVIHAPANVGPLSGPVPVALTVHDVLPFAHPEWVPGAYATALRALIAGAVRHASRILTVSEASRHDIATTLNPQATIDVVPLAGPEPDASPAPPRARRSYIAVANAMPHKNLALLVDVFAHPDLADADLTIYGSSRDERLLRAVDERGSANVTVAGWVSDEELDSAYRRATALLLPTRFEGFGLPVLEALGRGCPVVCSDLPVLREVAGDAARYVDPDDVDGWVSAILTLGSPDPETLRRRAGAFLWSATAEATAESLRRTARRP